MIGPGMMGLPIMVSDAATVSRKVRRVRFEDYVWRGRKEWRSWIVTVTVTEPAAFRMGDLMVVHPVIYEQLKRDADANADAVSARNPKPAGYRQSILGGGVWAI